MRWLLLLLACASAVQARPQVGRTLAQATQCTKWCSTDAGSCVLDKTTGKSVCRKCQNRMVPIRSGSGAGGCGCPAGRWFDYSSTESQSTCRDCDLGKYCSDKPFVVPTTQTTDTTQTDCPTNLTTKRKRSTLPSQCVTKPGYSYVASPVGGAACPAGTFNVGLNYATNCTSCPAGFVTDGEAKTSPQDCLVPAGYFLSGPGQVAPCPRGSFRSGRLSGTTAAADNRCTPCPEGITTAGVGSTTAANCTRLLPGYFASGTDTGTTSPTKDALIGTLCPIGYICPGSTDTDAATVTFSGSSPVMIPSATLTAAMTVKRCDAEFSFTASQTATAAALWTRTLGATTKEECFIPPGHYVEASGSPLAYAVAACASRTYQEEWVRPTASTVTSCTACGDLIESDAVTPLKYSRVKANGVNDDVEDLTVNVRGSSDACYLSRGWGMYYVLNPNKAGEYMFKAQKCNSNNYGATADKSYGLTATPCKNCPVGMETETLTDMSDTKINVTVDGVLYAIRDGNTANALFVHPLACVTRAGFGYDGRSATQCPVGTYNAAGNRNACTPCGYGLTTSAAGQDASGDCLAAPGFGQVGSTLQLCPRGEYNDEARATNLACKKCDDVNNKENSWTTDIGADHPDECSVCAPGYGGADVNNCEDCADATTPGYGPEFRSDTACISCPTQNVGFSFFYKETLIPYMSAPVVRSKATSPADCVSRYAQIESGLWYLAGASTANAATTLANCVTACNGDANCMFINFQYTATSVANPATDTTGTCTLATSGDTGTGLTAFKAVPAGDVGAASVKSVSTGLYTQWRHTARDGSGATIGTQEEIKVNSADVTSKAVAFKACDDDIACAGVYCEDASLENDTTTKCWKIKGVSHPQGINVASRSLTRAVPANFPQRAASSGK